MKKLTLLVLAAVCLTSCWTSIFTVAPEPTPVVATPRTETRVVVEQHPTPVYTTRVTTPTPKVTTVTTFVVTDYNTDMCFYLDLNAVAAAYAESHSVREFEQILNSSRYMINNLDLNHDGWIDYLRVIETYKGYYHALLIQACLAPGIFQDVATLVAERRPDVLFVEVIGDRYLYGYNYIVRPVFVKRPPMWDVYGRSAYEAWSSPYYYGYYPSYYTQPKPVYLNHYQAYVNTYMNNHQYCHHCDYPQQPYNNNYTQMTQSLRRNDFEVQHPDNSFERRVARTANGNQNVASARNAAQLRTAVNREVKEKDSSSSSSSSTRTTTTTSPTTTTTRGTSTTSTTSSSSSRTTSSTTGTTRPTETTVRQPNTTTVDTRVNKSGTTRTTVKTTDETGRTQTVKRESATRTSGSQNTPARSAQGTTTESSPRSSQRGR